MPPTGVSFHRAVGIRTSRDLLEGFKPLDSQCGLAKQLKERVLRERLVDHKKEKVLYTCSSYPSRTESG